MPIYEFYCHPCDYHVEELRKMCDYTLPECMSCGEKMEWIVSATTMHVWSTDRKFPNVTKLGDGSRSFESKAAYKAHLDANHIAEFSHSGLVKTPHGAEVTVYDNGSKSD